MCTNMSFVKNPYTGKDIYVKCGKCPACIMEKSFNRQFKIQDETERLSSYLPVFVTLNYSNEFVPYIKVEDYASLVGSHLSGCLPSSDSLSYLPVYRHRKVRLLYNPHKNKYSIKVIHSNEYVIHKFSAEDAEWAEVLKYYKPGDFQSLQKAPFGYVGVSYSKDFSDFIKRLRRYLEYRGLPRLLSYYRVAEYGPTTFRPHFHALLWFDVSRFSACQKRLDEKRTIYDRIKDGIVKNWPFASLYQRVRNVEIARNPAAYISSYISGSYDSGSVYNLRFIRARSSHSLGFGFCSRYNPETFKSRIRQGKPYYTLQYTTKKGEFVSASVPVPRHVSYRYVPRFKGFRFLSDFEIHRFLSFPTYRRTVAYTLGLSSDEFSAIERKINKCVSALGFSTLVEYADFYILYLRCLKYFNYEVFYNKQQDIHGILGSYANIDDVLGFGKYKVRNDFIYELFGDYDVYHYYYEQLHLDLNQFPENVSRDVHLQELFHIRRKKIKKNYLLNKEFYDDVSLTN